MSNAGSPLAHSQRYIAPSAGLLICTATSGAWASLCPTSGERSELAELAANLL